MKRLSILGSTGSIGGNVLNIVEKFPQDFSVDVLAAKGNVALLARQIEQFRPVLAVVYDENQSRSVPHSKPHKVSRMHVAEKRDRRRRQNRASE